MPRPVSWCLQALLPLLNDPSSVPEVTSDAEGYFALRLVAQSMLSSSFTTCPRPPLSSADSLSCPISSGPFPAPFSFLTTEPPVPSLGVRAFPCVSISECGRGWQV